MSAPTLSWRGLPYDRSAFLIKGTEMAFAYVPGTLSRFAIYETRGGRDEHGHPTLVYRLRDAATVSDADLRDGKKPSVVGTFSEPDEASTEALRIATP